MNVVVSSVLSAKAKITGFVNELVVPRKCLVDVSIATTSSSSKALKIGLISTYGLLHNLHILFWHVDGITANRLICFAIVESNCEVMRIVDCGFECRLNWS